jgi:hypothetical protein
MVSSKSGPEGNFYANDVSGWKRVKQCVLNVAPSYHHINHVEILLVVKRCRYKIVWIKTYHFFSSVTIHSTRVTFCCWVRLKWGKYLRNLSWYKSIRSCKPFFQ